MSTARTSLESLGAAVTHGARMVDFDHATPDVFLVSRHGGAGLSRNQTRGAGYVTPSRGVRQRADTVGDLWSDVRAAIAACGSNAVVTDLTAARMWGLPIPSRVLAEHPSISISVPPDDSRTERRGTHGRRQRLPSFHLTELNGVRVTTPVRTWLDCAPMLRRSDLVAVGDAILHSGIGAPGEFQHLLAWGYRRRGMTAVRWAVPILDGRAESPAESWVRVLVIEAGLPRPECNVDIFDGPRWLARVDLVWQKERVIVEYDGMGHLDEQQRRRDAQRLNDLQAAGWRVIVLTIDDLRRPERTIALIRAALS